MFAYGCAERRPRVSQVPTTGINQLPLTASRAEGAPPSSEVEHEPPTLAGVPCGPGGPSVRAKVEEWIPGKPPLSDMIITLQLENPPERPVWFVFDQHGRLPS